MIEEGLRVLFGFSGEEETRTKVAVILTTVMAPEERYKSISKLIVQSPDTDLVACIVQATAISDFPTYNEMGMRKLGDPVVHCGAPFLKVPRPSLEYVAGFLIGTVRAGNQSDRTHYLTSLVDFLFADGCSLAGVAEFSGPGTSLPDSKYEARRADFIEKALGSEFGILATKHRDTVEAAIRRFQSNVTVEAKKNERACLNQIGQIFIKRLLIAWYGSDVDRMLNYDQMAGVLGKTVKCF